MSFDVFLLGFKRGDAAAVDAAAVLETLARFSADPVTPTTERIRTADGTADIYRLDSAADGFMINNASGQAIWDALVEVADTAALTIIPVGCPTCVTRQEFLQHLPDELREDARIVESGQDLVSAFN